jgi:hypothetical protein
MCTHAHMHTNMCTHAHMHTYMCTRAHKKSHARARTHTHCHTNTNTSRTRDRARARAPAPLSNARHDACAAWLRACRYTRGRAANAASIHGIRHGPPRRNNQVVSVCRGNARARWRQRHHTPTIRWGALIEGDSSRVPFLFVISRRDTPLPPRCRVALPQQQ